MQGKQIVYFILGCAALLFGVMGIFLPLLPGTPFILLAAWLFSKSSPKFHDWLVRHKHLGPIIQTWQSGNGLTKQTKIKVITFIWLSLCVSIFLIWKIWATLGLVFIGLAVSFYILRLPQNGNSPTQ